MPSFCHSKVAERNDETCIHFANSFQVPSRKLSPLIDVTSDVGMRSGREEVQTAPRINRGLAGQGIRVMQPVVRRRRAASRWTGLAPFLNASNVPFTKQPLDFTRGHAHTPMERLRDGGPSGGQFPGQILFGAI